jgi:LysM repeat protein
LSKGQVVEARGQLSDAVLSGLLPPDEHAPALAEASRIAYMTILSEQIYDHDPYVNQHTIQAGDVLARIAPDIDLRVPSQLIARVNRVDARRLRAGQILKVVRGPFHAIIHKRSFSMDVYLHREGLNKVYVKRVRIGLNDRLSIPVGLWHVAAGSKLSKAAYVPSPTKPGSRTIQFDEPNYPFGKEGYWIGLESVGNGHAELRYGIHGTSDPSSIGSGDSVGCIALGDADMDLVFALLCEKWSTVEVRPD